MRVRKASRVYAGTARLYLATADILDGKLRAASEQLESDVLLDSKDANEVAEFIRRHLLARTLLLAGTPGRGTQASASHAQDARARSRWARWWHERLVAGALLVKLSDVTRAQTVLKQLEQGRSSAFAQNCYHTLAGEIALAEGKPGEAVQQLAAAAAQYPRVIYHRGAARARSSAQRDWQRARPRMAQGDRFRRERSLREHFAPNGCWRIWKPRARAAPQGMRRQPAGITTASWSSGRTAMRLASSNRARAERKALGSRD